MEGEENAQPGQGFREDSPLLVPSHAGSDEEGFKDSPTRETRVTPLPRTQLATIYAIKLIVPVAGTQILPYVNKMVAGFDLPSERSVGYYTGLLSFAHTAGQILTIYAWGRLSGEYMSTFVTLVELRDGPRLGRQNSRYRRRDGWTRTGYPGLWHITQLRFSTNSQVFL